MVKFYSLIYLFTSAHCDDKQTLFLSFLFSPVTYWDSFSISEIKALNAFHNGHPSWAYVGANGLYGSQRNVPDKQS